MEFQFKNIPSSRRVNLGTIILRRVRLFSLNESDIVCQHDIPNPKDLLTNMRHTQTNWQTDRHQSFVPVPGSCHAIQTCYDYDNIYRVEAGVGTEIPGWGRRNALPQQTLAHISPLATTQLKSTFKQMRWNA